MFFVFFFFNDTATTEIYTLSLHDALPISSAARRARRQRLRARGDRLRVGQPARPRARRARALRRRGHRHREAPARSEEHTSELQSPCNLVCRLLLEKKKTNRIDNEYIQTY